jgi:glycosyltransferase involved in cell wall biosynthesis
VKPSAPRVLILPASYFARDRVVGGGERYALEYARALAELTPTTLGLFDLKRRREIIDRLEIRTFPVRRLTQPWGFPLTRETWRAFRDFDVLHCLVFPTPLTDLLLLAARLRRQKIVLTDVGGGGPCWSTYLGKISRRFNLNRLAHGLALLSRHSAQAFSDWSQPRTVLHGGVDLQQFPVSSTPPQGYALFVGRLLPHKGVLQLVQAVDADTPLHVVGRPYDDNYVGQLRAAAVGKRVQFIFDADDAELRRQYAGANVVLQPSLPSENAMIDTSELLGLVTLEAMACGKPVVVTRAGSLPELMVDGETGFLVAPHDAAALRECITRLVSNPGLSQTMGAAARKHVAAHFTWEQAARRGFDFYHTLVAAKSQP